MDVGWLLVIWFMWMLWILGWLLALMHAKRPRQLRRYRSRYLQD